MEQNSIGYQSRVNIDPAWTKKDSFKFYHCEKISRTVLKYICFIMAKAQSPDVNNGLDTRQNRAVTLAE